MTSSETAPIWTLEARDSVMLDVMSSYFDMSDAAMRAEIWGARQILVEGLGLKDVAYEDLRNALVPQRTRRELGLLFDTARIESNWYGYDVAERVIPTLPRDLMCSIMSGDLIIENQDLGFALLERYVQPVRSVDLRHTTQLYCVYVNNLSARMVETMTASLEPYEPFVGYVDASTSSPMKDWFSVTLVNSYLKARRVILNGHEDDVSDEENFNMLGWPWEMNGYRVASLRDMYYHLFLAYKIERRVLPGLESDTRFALTAISETPLALEELPVRVEEAKGEYLRGDHGGSLERAGLTNLADEQLAEVIRAKISESYIYHLRYRPQSDTSLFNIMLEIPHPKKPDVVTRLAAALEYDPGTPELRVVTLY